ncbi:MAG: NUDIX hydrolase [Ignisphaera sp.]|uniref:NUDIX hydrolase n=1 Tax=Ignisphaera aggregans TaxID=334771 RepID=A0A7J3MY61_9CREN
MVQLVEERTLCRGKRVELIQRVYMYSTEVFVKDVVRFGQSVAIVPFKDMRKIVMVKQFRAPINKWILEIPAGRIEFGESPEEAVVRELREEVGYVPKYVQKLVSVYMSPGYSDEVIHIYVAKNLEYVGASPEKGELIEIVEVDIDKALEMILADDAADAKTLIALLSVKQLS